MPSAQSTTSSAPTSGRSAGGSRPARRGSIRSQAQERCDSRPHGRPSCSGELTSSAETTGAAAVCIRSFRVRSSGPRKSRVTWVDSDSAITCGARAPSGPRSAKYWRMMAPRDIGTHSTSASRPNGRLPPGTSARPNPAARSASRASAARTSSMVLPRPGPGVEEYSIWPPCSSVTVLPSGSRTPVSRPASVSGSPPQCRSTASSTARTPRGPE